MILLIVICGAWYVVIQKNNIFMVPSNVTQAIISYDDDQLKEAHDAFYFEDEDKEIRTCGFCISILSYRSKEIQKLR